MSLRRISIIGIVALPLAGMMACNRSTGSVPTPPDNTSSAPAYESSSEQSSVIDTHEYSYQGVVQPIEVSVSMEGTHKLVLPNGSFLLLRSSVQDLEPYIGKEVEVTGTVKDAVEGGVKIMDVVQASLVSGQSSSMEDSSSSSEVSSSLPSSSSSSSSSVSSRSVPSPAPKKPVVSSSSSSKSVASVPPAPPAETSSLPPDMQAKVKKMARVRGEEAWTQQYCSSHISVCFPLRSDYWYHSFGTTTTYLWHVEISSEDLHNLGDGPIEVNLVDGRLNSSIQDQAVVVKDGKATGYRSWTGSRHFEITGPVELKASIEYITNNIIPYEPPQGSSSSARSK